MVKYHAIENLWIIIGFSKVTFWKDSKSWLVIDQQNEKMQESLLALLEVSQTHLKRTIKIIVLFFCMILVIFTRV